MPLFVSTVSSNVVVAELGITLTHPTTNFQVDAQFSAESIALATGLTTAILGGQLTWKKTSTGSVEPASSYDPEFVELEQEAIGGQSSFGSYLARASDETESQTTNTITYSTKLTLITPNLPLGDYVGFCNYKRRLSSQNRTMTIRMTHNGNEIWLDEPFITNTNDWPINSQYFELLNVQGVQNLTLQYKSGSVLLETGSTAYISKCSITLWRVR